MSESFYDESMHDDDDDHQVPGSGEGNEEIRRGQQNHRNLQQQHEELQTGHQVLQLRTGLLQQTLNGQNEHMLETNRELLQRQQQLQQQQQQFLQQQQQQQQQNEQQQPGSSGASAESPQDMSAFAAEMNLVIKDAVDAKFSDKPRPGLRAFTAKNIEVHGKVSVDFTNAAKTKKVRKE